MKKRLYMIILIWMIGILDMSFGFMKKQIQVNLFGDGFGIVYMVVYIKQLDMMKLVNGLKFLVLYIHLLS